jgi:hypothetical protein
VAPAIIAGIEDHSTTVAEVREKIKTHHENLSLPWSAPPQCPRATEHDECHIRRKGFRVRHPKIGGGVDLGPVKIRQLECLLHGRFRDYPEFLLAHKHYVAEIVDEALASRPAKETVEQFCERCELPDPRTPRRWIRRFVERLDDIGRYTERRLTGLSRDPPSHQPECWQYAHVWRRLGDLQKACRSTCQPVSRSHLAFSA